MGWLELGVRGSVHVAIYLWGQQDGAFYDFICSSHPDRTPEATR